MAAAIDWAAYAKGVEADIARIKEYLTPLESGVMKLGSQEVGGQWKDVTQEAIDREWRVLKTYEAILADVRANRIGK
ncbi:MAG: hypothetical protein JWR35_3777 [Marmoricola sp.]|nr:hypothetical protein [Marmoricola sp.]